MFRGDTDDTIIDDPYWTQPSSPSSSLMTGMIRISMTSLFISYILLVRHPHLHSNQKTTMKNGGLNIKEQLRKFVPIIRNYNTITKSIFMVSADQMDLSHPLEGSIPTTVAAILAMTGQMIPPSHPTLAPPTDLQHHIKLMRLNGIIGLKYMRITHLLLIQSLPHRP